MSTTSYGRSRSGDRFYNPPQVRRQLQLQQQQQQLISQKQHKLEREDIRRDQNHHHHQQQRRHHKPAALRAKVAESLEIRPDSNDCGATTATTTLAASVSPNSTNLDRFLEYTTPVVPAQHFSKTSMKGWRTQEDDPHSYFVLGDLWESFKEWSAYGAGVPLLLNGSDSVVQYYVPYLSGIQLYIDSLKPSLSTRQLGEESDESSRETSSDGSSDCEIERRASSLWSQQELAESTLQDIKGLSLWNKPSNGSSSDEGDTPSSSPGALVFEYLEHDAPYSREPLADKISILASQFPELKTYRSCDLSASSWVSVAWYPIYRIPTGPTLQNLDSCFLTFHPLSTPTPGVQKEWLCHFGSCAREVPNGFDMAHNLSLPIFGMACYKFKISVWDQNGVEECQRANSLLRATDEWLRLLNVNHPDYRFFVSHSYHWR